MGNLNTLNIKQPIDFSIFGGLDSKGNIKKVIGEDAINNSLKVWLLSKEGDYIRNPSKGGYLYNHLCKPMSEFNQRRIETSLKIGLKQEFFPKIVVQNLQVIADYEKKQWTIIIQGIIPEFRKTISFTQDFKSLI